MRPLSRSMTARGMPSEYWISICSFRPSFGSWGQSGAWASDLNTMSSACPASVWGKEPMAVAMHLVPVAMGFVSFGGFW